MHWDFLFGVYCPSNMMWKETVSSVLAVGCLYCLTHKFRVNERTVEIQTELKKSHEWKHYFARKLLDIANWSTNQLIVWVATEAAVYEDQG